MLLTDDRYKEFHIHCHRVSLYNPENRNTAERVAVSKILNWYKANGYADRITYSTSTVAIPSVNGKFLWDADVYKFVTGWLSSASDEMIKHVAFGVTMTDDSTSLDHVIRGKKIYQIFESKRTSEIYPVRHLTKQQVWDMLPDDLRGMAWSCRRPLYINDQAFICKECKTCKQIAAFG